jgi:hypothetical protein
MSRSSSILTANRPAGNVKFTAGGVRSMSEPVLDPPAPQRQFKGVWLCAAVLDDEALSPAEKILLAEVDSLTNPEKACYASNEFLAKRLHLSPAHMRDTLADLTTSGYLIRLAFTGRVTLRCVHPMLSSNAPCVNRLIEAHGINLPLGTPPWKPGKQRKSPDTSYRKNPTPENSYRENPIAEASPRENPTPEPVSEGKIRYQQSEKPDTEKLSKENSTKRETTTTPRAHVSAKGMRLVAEEVREVVVVSSVVVEEEEEEPSKEEYWPDEDDSPVADQSPWPDDEAEEELPTVTEGQKTASAAVDAIATEFRLNVSERGETHEWIAKKGLAYVEAKAAHTRSHPCRNQAKFFLGALKGDWQQPRSNAPTPKKKATEPAGWRVWLLAKYPTCEVEQVKTMTWKEFGDRFPSERIEFLRQPTTPLQAPAPPDDAKSAFGAMRAAVQNVGKEETAA